MANQRKEIKNTLIAYLAAKGILVDGVTMDSSRWKFNRAFPIDHRSVPLALVYYDQDRRQDDSGIDRTPTSLDIANQYEKEVDISIQGIFAVAASDTDNGATAGDLSDDFENDLFEAIAENTTVSGTADHIEHLNSRFMISKGETNEVFQHVSMTFRFYYQKQI